MKKSIIFLVLAAMLLQSCDFVRRLAGRPTAAQVEAIREQRYLEEQARFQAIRDSLEAVQAAKQDTLDKVKSKMVPASKLGGISGSKLKTKYCIVVGAFRNVDNAQRKRKQCDLEGYTAGLVRFRNGLIAVAVCPTDSAEQAARDLLNLIGTPVCPKDGWILVNE